MTKNRTLTPVYLDSGMHPGLEVKGLTTLAVALIQIVHILYVSDFYPIEVVCLICEAELPSGYKF